MNPTGPSFAICQPCSLLQREASRVSRLTLWDLCILTRSLNLALESEYVGDHVGRLEQIVLGLEDLIVRVSAPRFEEVEQGQDEVTVEVREQLRGEVG